MCVHANGSLSPVTIPKARGRKSKAAVFDQDFQEGNPNVVMAGGRSKRLWLTDLRAEPTDYLRSYMQTSSSIAHVKSLNEHQVLVAELQDTMVVYDVRKFSQTTFSAETKPLYTFPGYRNAAHYNLGWDVSTEMGIVAAAQDGGLVRLFSLRTGRTLHSPALDDLNNRNHIKNNNTTMSPSPIRSMMFQKMKRDKLPSLWVGEGSSLVKYSFTTNYWDEADE